MSAIPKRVREILREGVLNFTRKVWDMNLCLKKPKNKSKNSCVFFFFTISIECYKTVERIETDKVYKRIFVQRTMLHKYIFNTFLF